MTPGHSTHGQIPPHIPKGRLQPYGWRYCQWFKYLIFMESVIKFRLVIYYYDYRTKRNESIRGNKLFDTRTAAITAAAEYIGQFADSNEHNRLKVLFEKTWVSAE
jgi:hypothetical protein